MINLETIEVSKNSMIVVTVDDTVEFDEAYKAFETLKTFYPNNIVAMVRPGIHLEAKEYESYRAWLKQELEFIESKFSEQEVEN